MTIPRIERDGTRYETAPIEMNLESFKNGRGFSNADIRRWLEDKGCWHGTVDVDGVTREIWFEDPESSEIRIGIIASHDVAGLAYWRLGQEDPEVWQSVRSHGFCK